MSIECIAKTDCSLTVTWKEIPHAVAYKVSYSEYGYVFYSWTEVITINTKLTIKDLNPKTFYAVRVHYSLGKDSKQQHEWKEHGEIIQFRTFTTEEANTRSSLVFEHAFKIQKEERTNLKNQVEKLNRMLENTKKSNNENCQKQPLHTLQNSLFLTRADVDSRISKLREEQRDQAIQLSALEEQKRLHENVIHDLIAEGEKLKKQQMEMANKDSATINELHCKIQENEKQLSKQQNTRVESEKIIHEYERSLKAKEDEIYEKENEVERIMSDCRRALQEHTDLMQAKTMEMEDALYEAKCSLEQQMESNRLLQQEMERITKENDELKEELRQHRR